MSTFYADNIVHNNARWSSGLKRLIISTLVVTKKDRSGSRFDPVNYNYAISQYKGVIRCDLVKIEERNYLSV